MRKPSDLSRIGMIFGELTILEEVLNASNRRRYLVKCSCGNRRIVPFSRVVHGSSRSCGCKMKEYMSAARKTHGMKKTGIYKRWAAMKSRCLSSRHPAYKNYGGRGITICREWITSFEAFYKDMGDPPFVGACLDRIDNDGNYNKNNCRWVTMADNNRNKRTTK